MPVILISTMHSDGDKPVVFYRATTRSLLREMVRPNIGYDYVLVYMHRFENQAYQDTTQVVFRMADSMLEKLKAETPVSLFVCPISADGSVQKLMAQLAARLIEYDDCGGLTADNVQVTAIGGENFTIHQTQVFSTTLSFVYTK